MGARKALFATDDGTGLLRRRRERALDTPIEVPKNQSDVRSLAQAKTTRPLLVFLSSIDLGRRRDKG